MVTRLNWSKYRLFSPCRIGFIPHLKVYVFTQLKKHAETPIFNRFAAQINPNPKSNVIINFNFIKKLEPYTYKSIEDP